MRSLILDHYKVPLEHTNVRQLIVLLHPCNCARVKQVRTLKLPDSSVWTRSCQSWPDQVQRNGVDSSNDILCTACEGALHGGNGAEHSMVVNSIKDFVEQQCDEWWVFVEFLLEPGVQQSKGADMLLVHARATHWKHTVAVEIDPDLHSTNKMKHGSRVCVEQSDIAKDGKYAEMALQHERLSHLSWRADGSIDSAWLATLQHDMNVARP